MKLKYLLWILLPVGVIFFIMRKGGGKSKTPATATTGSARGANVLSDIWKSATAPLATPGPSYDASGLIKSIGDALGNLTGSITKSVASTTKPAVNSPVTKVPVTVPDVTAPSIYNDDNIWDGPDSSTYWDDYNQNDYFDNYGYGLA